MSSAKHVRLALLICDTPNPAVLSFRGDYLSIYTHHLRVSLPPNSNATFTLDGFDVRRDEYPENDSDYDGIVITGSVHSAYEDVEWVNKLIAYVADTIKTKPHIKIVGICFGHQIVARALGGQCVPNNGKWEAGVYEVELTDLGRELFGKPTINIQQMHRDHVPTLPPSVHLLGTTPLTPIQGFILPSSSPPPTSSSLASNIHVLTLQGHPEFTSDIINAIVDAREKTGAMDEATVKEARSRAVRPNDDAGAIGDAIWKVFGVTSNANGG